MFSDHLDFINLSAKEQTNIILAMIKMDYSTEEITMVLNSEVAPSGINTDNISRCYFMLKQKKFYKQREESTELESHYRNSKLKILKNGLPENYNRNRLESFEHTSLLTKFPEAEIPINLSRPLKT